MDDYNTSMLSEAKNEYCVRLLNILTPLVIEGIKSILKEADQLCIQNDEESKYLMTFQNFLSRVPKWNNDIISEETDRIIKKSGCNYLEDLLTCVHITQLKVLTSIRVGSLQKKIELDIPKLNDFIHKIYISFARKIYSNVYLFEKNVQPLTYQKNMREAETICKECILDVIRESIPVERILRSYIDESVEEEVVEEVTETLQVDASENKQEESSTESSSKEKPKEVTVKKSGETKEEVKKIVKNVENKVENKVEKKLEKKVEKKDDEKSLKIDTPIIKKDIIKDEVADSIKKIIKEEKNVAVPTKLTFNDTDTLYDKKTMEKEEKSAPKTIERLEAISAAAHKKRKEEEEAEDYDDDEKIKIFRDAPSIKLDTLDIHDLSKEIKLAPDISNEIEVLTT